MAPTALITGASQGIGEATALLFASKGYDLVLAARHRDRLAVVAEEIQKLDRQALVVPTDVRDPDQVKNLIDKALEHYGAIDVLINNAGIYVSGPVESFSLEEWHHTIDTNLCGYVHTIHSVLPHMLARRQGAIVNISSIGGKVPIPYLAPYTATKFGVAGMTAAMHSELKPKGIHVCGIYPNIIKTRFTERAIFTGHDEADAQSRRQQLEEILHTPFVEKPEDVAKAIWEGVKHQRAEVVVGSANFAQAAYSVFPGVVQWLSRQTFKR
ncbi:SDR family NAD(P)-dependent oxidoreductase [Chroococcidiopsis sp.]|uniref:SDR family NAD(P)-dependent oxidoreductase n=1 Tax=Chroococcidiopsis sp. TaxID=3088168 RepID=UPI003F2AB27F